MGRYATPDDDRETVLKSSGDRTGSVKTVDMTSGHRQSSALNAGLPGDGRLRNRKLRKRHTFLRVYLTFGLRHPGSSRAPSSHRPHPSRDHFRRGQPIPCSHCRARRGKNDSRRPSTPFRQHPHSRSSRHRDASAASCRRAGGGRSGSQKSEVGNSVAKSVITFVSIAGSARYAPAVLTEGILTRQLLDDPFLEGIGAVLLDEFHERNIHSDLAIALLREIRQTVRPDLVLIVMSATLDAEPDAPFLGDCPIIRVQGRMFPVDLEHVSSPVGMRADAIAGAVADALDKSSRVQEDAENALASSGRRRNSQIGGGAGSHRP